MSIKPFRKFPKNHHKTSTVIGVVSPKSSLNIAPPKNVIRAKRDYVPQLSGELAFSKGDFFHVIAENDPNRYEVFNPATDMRGLVPVECFEVLGKTVGPPALNSSTSG